MCTAPHWDDHGRSLQVHQGKVGDRQLAGGFGSSSGTRTARQQPAALVD